MNHSKGFTLIELAVVLVIMGVLSTTIVGGFALYRDRADYLANGRAAELEELIAMDKRHPVEELEPVVTPPPPPPEPEPVIEDGPEHRPIWVRWLEWWRSIRRGRA